MTAQDSGTQRVLITGANGFIGSHLVRRTVGEGYCVHTIMRPGASTWRLRDVLSRVNRHEISSWSYEELKDVAEDIKPHIIFHTSASGIHGGVCESESVLIEHNVLGTVNLINACAEIEYTCFVNSGSSAEYGPKSCPMHEREICEPITLYGISKLSSTLYAGYAARSHGKPIVTLRLFSPYGEFDDAERLIIYTGLTALKGCDLNLADPLAARDFVYIDDVVDAYMRCIDRADDLKGEVFNIGSGTQVNISVPVECIREYSGYTGKVRWGSLSRREYDTDRWEADLSKTRTSLGWSPVHSLEQGLKKTVTWLKTHKDLYSDENQG